MGGEQVYELRFRHGPERESRVAISASGDGAAVMLAYASEPGVMVEVWQADRFIARLIGDGERRGCYLH